MSQRTDRGFSSFGCWSGFCSKTKQEEEGRKRKERRGRSEVEEEWRRKWGRRGGGEFQQVEEGSDQGFQKFVFSSLLPWLPLAC